MIETIFFICGTVIGFGISFLSYKTGSRSAHEAYEVINTTPPEKQDEPTKTNSTSESYDWDEYSTAMKHEKLNIDEDNLEEKPN